MTKSRQRNYGFQKGGTPWNKGKSPWNKGLYLSDDHKRKISETMSGRSCSNPESFFSTSFKKGRTAWNKGEPLTPEHRENVSKALSGSNNPNWQGGISQIYGWDWTQTLRKAIRERDGFRCQVCGKEYHPNGRKLSVHHIDYDKMNNNPKNLITLCTSCHVKTTAGNHDKWKRFFSRPLGSRPPTAEEQAPKSHTTITGKGLASSDTERGGFPGGHSLHPDLKGVEVEVK